MKKIVIIGLFVLSGCVTSQYASEKSVCESKSSWIEYAQCSNRIGTQYYGDDPLEHEMIAYRNLLIEKVKSNQITPTEAEYLRQQKWNKAKQKYNGSNYYSGPDNLNTAIYKNNERMMEAMKNHRQNSSSPAPVYTSPVQTNCSPDGYGGMRCTTY